MNAWLSEIGLVLDLIAFVLLSADLVSALRGERQARDDLILLEKKIFAGRYGIFAPDKETRDAEEVFFNLGIDNRIQTTDRSMKSRRQIAYWAIGIATVGFILQIVGGWPQ